MSKVKYNLRNVHYAIKTAEGYETPVAIPGAVSLTREAQGDDYVFYADGIRYYEYHTNNGYKGDLEVAMIPDSFKTDVLGEVLDTAKNLVELAGSPTVYFAFGFEVETDTTTRKFWFYKCTASRPSEDANTTEESIEVQTDTLSWTCSPDSDHMVVDAATGKSLPAVRIASTDESTTQNWFQAVVEPTSAQVEG